MNDLITDILDGINNYTQIYINTMPKKFYRKIRFKKNIKRRYMIRINHLHDLLLSPNLILRPLKHLLKEKNKWPIEKN